MLAAPLDGDEVLANLLRREGDASVALRIRFVLDLYWSLKFSNNQQGVLHMYGWNRTVMIQIKHQVSTYLWQLLQVAWLLRAAGGDDVGLEGAEVVVGEAVQNEFLREIGPVF